jgi:DNA ligase 1
MLLADAVATSAALAATRSRTAKIDLLADLLGRAGRDELPVVVGFLSGEPRQGKVGVGYAAVFAVDVPAAAEPSLTVGDVDAAIDAVAAASGAGSQGTRRDILTSLLGRATAPEQEFLRRLLVGELRQGALEGVMVEAIARVADVAAAAVRRALMLHPDLGAVAGVAATDGVEGLSRFRLEVLRPVRPMLAKTAADVASALDAVGTASVEWKLDGVRIQAHRQGDEAMLATRNLNDVTDRLPEVAEVVRSLDVASVVLDGEAIALTATGEPRPFNETMSRFGTEEGDPSRVPLVPFFFDVLACDGEDLIDLPLHARQEVLDRVIPERWRVPHIVTDDPDQAAAFLAAARARRHEGVMVKGIDGVYQAGQRGGTWLKVKPAHTLDLVVLAAEWGHGRRTGTLSNIHLGARDPARGGFVMLGKTFKGMTDETLAWQTRRFLALEERRTRSTVYVRPEQVVEVAFDGIQASPRYPAGMALRFARVKGYRLDKTAAEADTIDTVRAIFEGGAAG